MNLTWIQHKRFFWGRRQKKPFTNKQATPEWYRRCYNKIGDLECHPFKLLFIMLFLFWTLLSLPRPALCFKFHLYLQVQILDDIFYVFINVFQHFTVICFNFHLPSSKRLERCFFYEIKVNEILFDCLLIDYCCSLNYIFYVVLSSFLN